MSEDPIVAFRNVSKIFELYPDVQSVFWANMPLFRRFRRSSKTPLSTKLALQDVSFSIRRGEKVGVIGRNGSGKTTLLRLVIGQTQQSSGDIIRNGNSQALMHTGFGFSLELSGLENVRNSLLYNGLDPNEHQRFLDDIVDFVELGDFIHYPLKTYSLGMHARLVFATATAIRPDLLVVDEVMGAGDGYFARKSAERMRNLVENSTLMLVSHSLQQVNEFCDRVLWINDGELVADGPTEKVLDEYEVFMAAYNARRGLGHSSAAKSQSEIADGDADVAENQQDLQNAFENVLSVTVKFQKLLGVNSHTFDPECELKVTQPDGAGYVVCPVGDTLRLNLSLQLLDDAPLKADLHIWGFSETGAYLFKSSVQLPQIEGKDSYELTLSKEALTVGIGDYILFFGATHTETGKLIAVSWDPIKLRVPPTNYSDPPYVHLEGTWHHEARAPEPARINAWV